MSRGVEELTRLYFEDVDNPLTRRAIEAAAVVRRTTEPILDAMLGGNGKGRAATAPRAPLRRARTRRARASRIRPRRGRRLTCGARTRCATGSTGARRGGGSASRCGPRPRPSCGGTPRTPCTCSTTRSSARRSSPSDVQPVAVEPATAGDWPSIRVMAERHEGPGSARLLQRWWTVAPSAFSVMRDGDGEVTGFFVLLYGDLSLPRRGRPGRRHLGPPPAGQPAAAGRGRDGPAALARRRPRGGARRRPRRRAGWTSSGPTWRCGRRCAGCTSPSRTCGRTGPSSVSCGSAPFAAPAVLDGREYTTVVLDFGPDSVDGWLVEVARLPSSAWPTNRPSTPAPTR